MGLAEKPGIAPEEYETAARAQQLSADIELAFQAESDYDGPDGWAQGSRAGCYMTRQELLVFFDECMALLRKYGHDQADAPEGARHMALRFFALPDPGQPAPGPPPEQRTKTADKKEMSQSRHGLPGAVDICAILGHRDSRSPGA